MSYYPPSLLLSFRVRTMLENFHSLRKSEIFRHVLWLMKSQRSPHPISQGHSFILRSALLSLKGPHEFFTVIKSHQFLLEGCLPCWRGAYYTPLDHTYIRSVSTRASLLPLPHLPARWRSCTWPNPPLHFKCLPALLGQALISSKAPDIPGNAFPSQVMDGRVPFIHSACFLCHPHASRYTLHLSNPFPSGAL